jgi:hypothetical protein
LQDSPAPVQPKSQALLSACDAGILLLISWKVRRAFATSRVRNFVS